VKRVWNGHAAALPIDPNSSPLGISAEMLSVGKLRPAGRSTVQLLQ
jgi:hypothetical protein